MDAISPHLEAASEGSPARELGTAANAKGRATTEMILSMPIHDRLRQIEAEANFFSSIRPLED